MRVLFLSRWYPYPANNGSKLRIHNLLRGLGRHHEVDLVSFYDPTEGQPDQDGLKDVCQSVKVVPWHEFDPTSLRAIRGFLSFLPRSILDTYSPEMSRMLHGLIGADQYNLIIASQIDMAVYAIELKKIPILLEEAEIGVYVQKAQQTATLKERFRHNLTWWKYRRYLRFLFSKVAAATVVSQKEKGLLQSAIPEARKVVIIPNCMQLRDYERVSVKAEPDSLIYTGSFRYDVNYEAMVWFMKEVYPLVQARHPQARLIITGDPAGKLLPAARNLTQTGAVSDVRPWLAAARVALAPLQTGGGTRLKILEAMALHTPVVSTSKGAEGLEALPGVHLLVADRPQDFADAVLSLLSDDAMHQQFASAGFDLVRQKYNWDAVLPDFLQLVEKTAQIGAQMPETDR